MPAWLVRLCLLKALWACLASGLCAQPEVWLFHRLTNRGELAAQGNNKYIYHDSHGLVWISSMDGLTRLAGQTVKRYTHDPDDPHSLADNNIQSRFFEDARGDLWFSTTKAIHRYDRKMDRFHRHVIRAEDGKPLTNYWIVCLDVRKEELWLGAGNALYLFPLDTSRAARPLGTYSLGYNTQSRFHQGTLHFFTPKGGDLLWHRFAGHQPKGPPTIISLASRVPNYHGTALAWQGDSVGWIGGRHGLLRLSLPDARVQTFPALRGATVSALTLAGDEALLVAIRDRGLFLLDADEPALNRPVLSDRNGQARPFRPVVNHMYMDRDSTFWFSCHGQGVYFSNPRRRKFRAYLQDRPENTGLGRNVRAMTQDARGQIWCRTQFGIRILDEDGRPVPDAPQPPPPLTPYADEQMLDIHGDRAGRIWLASLDGLHVLRPGERAFRPVRLEDGSKSPGFFYLAELNDGSLLASSTATDRRALMRVRQQGGRFFLEPALCEGSAFSAILTKLTQLPDGRVLVNEEGNFIHVLSEGGHGLSIDTSLAFAPTLTGYQLDRDSGWIWLASFDGLYKLSNSSGGWALKKDPYVPSGHSLKGILQDDAGQLWISTQKGLLRYDPHHKGYITYGLSQGLQAQQFNLSAQLKTRDGRLAFGGPNGLNLFRPEEIQAWKKDARPLITRILINDQEPENLFCQLDSARNVSLIRKLELPYAKNTLSFYFDALEYSDPEANTFDYQMKNLDPVLLSGETRRFARYANLPPGDYAFVVYGYNSDGRQAREPARVELTILPPFYLTWWFLSLAGLAIAGFIAGAFRLRLNQLRKEAEYQRNVAQVETAVLRLQMNPHFIFNTMNSIGSFILQNDMAKAHDYLGRFGKLMREILDYAKKPYLELSEDLALLEQYLQLEGMRLNGKLDYRIAIDPDVDPDEVLVPTMILQPFVENAIWHGIAPKPGGGRIRIHIRKAGQQLLAAVEDDGIGRQASAARKKRSEKRESKAVRITRHRLDLLEQEYQVATNLAFEDLQDEQGRPAGTRVLLTLPLL